VVLVEERQVAVDQAHPAVAQSVKEMLEALR
jgi:hypothetical protein